MNPFANPTLAADYETWYQTAGRRADQLENALLVWLWLDFHRRAHCLTWAAAAAILRAGSANKTGK